MFGLSERCAACLQHAAPLTAANNSSDTFTRFKNADENSDVHDRSRASRARLTQRSRRQPQRLHTLHRDRFFPHIFSHFYGFIEIVDGQKWQVWQSRLQHCNAMCEIPKNATRFSQIQALGTHPSARRAKEKDSGGDFSPCFGRESKQP
jgi:hypothetical protein